MPVPTSQIPPEMQQLHMPPQQLNLHTQMLYRQGQTQGGGMGVNVAPTLMNPYPRNSPVPMYPPQMAPRKTEEPPLSVSPTPGQQAQQGNQVVQLGHGARIIHHPSMTDSTVPSVVTPDVRHWKHDGKNAAEDRVQLPRQYARGSSKRKPCNCKQSRCLKLYCECFAAGQTCQSCNCVNCANNTDNEVIRQEAIRSTLKRSPPSQKMNKVRRRPSCARRRS